MDTVIDIAIPVAVMIIMISIGFGVTRDDLRTTLAARNAFLFGVAAQLLLVPAAALVFLLLLQPDRHIALGIMILGLCPGGALSNILTRVAGGDVALSVSITAFTNVFSVVTLPALSVLAADYFVGQSLNAAEVQTLVMRVALIGTAPVLLGMCLRYILPVFAERHGARFFRLALVVFVIIMGWAILESIEVFYASMLQLGWQLLAMLCIMLALGIGVGQMRRFAVPSRITLIFEIAVQNAALGIAVGSLISRDSSGFSIYTTPAAVYGSLTLLLLLPFVALVSRASKYGVSARSRDP